MRPFGRTTIAIAALICALSAVVPASGVSVSQTYPIPASGAFTLIGHGFGHGHGMGQYGAEGAARQGLTYSEILAFYYPGTAVGSVSGDVRVLITADTTDDVVVAAASGLRAKDLGSGATYSPVKTGATRWRLKVVSGTTVLQYRTDRWHRFVDAQFTGEGQFSRVKGPLTLVTPSGTRSYRGALRAAAPSAGSAARDTVNVVSLENYVRGVVPAEIPTSWHANAVRAQAIAARTYALWWIQSRSDRPWQICDTSACQVYRGFSGETAAGNAAVSATAGAMLTYSGRPAFTQFSSSSGGFTSAGSAPYLVAKADPYDDWAGNKVHSWSVGATASLAQKRYPEIGTLSAIKVTSREGGGQWQGRVLSLTLIGSTGTKVLTGSEFRSLYGLRSTWFAVE
jgi:SpoIID/LytB domain protein